MFFVIQKDVTGAEAVQNAIVIDVLERNKYAHSYILMDSADLYRPDDDGDGLHAGKVLKTADEFEERYRNAIPFGSVRFIEAYLQVFKGIRRNNAIEVLPVLRTDEFLKRNYSIVRRDAIPRHGSYFLKDATRLKSFSYAGDMEYFLHDEMFEERKRENDFLLRLAPDHLYQVSEIVHILAEYRVYVVNGEVSSMYNFSGDPMLFPDAELVKKAVRLINEQPDSPRSYSLDLMMTARGTAITEVHNFLGSLGLYTTNWGEELLYAYRQGMEYAEQYNIEQTEFSNF